jgi:REP element-mobilizing transposase RayT
MSEFRKANTDKAFFLTFVVVGWIDVFNRAEYCEEFLNNLDYCRKNKGLRVYAYCIMSSHIHLIVSADDIKLPGIIRDLKSYTAKRLLKLISENPKESRKEWILYQFRYFASSTQQNSEHQFWQKTNHPIELLTAKMFDQKMDYIHDNPVEAMIVSDATAYVHSSANPDSAFKVDEA